MALDQERFSGTITRVYSLLDRAKAVGEKTRDFAAKISSQGGKLASRYSAWAEDFSYRLLDTARAHRMPRWLRLFINGFVRTHRAWSPVRQFFADVFVRPIVRFISSSLWRRILASNLLGFAILVGGFLYLSQSSTVLIEEKRRTLEVQAEMIAAAIASGATIRSDQIYIDADKLPLDPNTLFPTREDAFTRHEMTLSPEQLAPILKKMVRATKARAQVLNFDGRLIIDTASLLTRGQIMQTALEDKEKRSKPKNFWTRVLEFMIGREFEVYQQRDNVHPTDYPEVRRALSTGKSQAMMLLTDSGEQIVSAIVPIQRMRSLQGIVMLSSREGELSDILRKNRNQVWPLALVALIATLVTSYFLSRTVAGPMRRLSGAAENVSKNINAAQKLPELADRTDEVGQMARSFRAMTDALFRRIEGSERFAADVAHELKNPLTAASSTAESLAFAKTPEQRAQLVEQIRGELKRLNRLITDVSSASRLDAELARQSKDPVPIADLLGGLVSAFDAKCEAFGCNVQLKKMSPVNGPRYTKNAETLTVLGNGSRLAQVMTNLIDNAISFSTEGDTVTVVTQRDGDTVRVAVEDEGPGIDEDKLETIFDRFYTYRPTEESSRGDNSGLGLNITREIVLAHGGNIWAENRYANASSYLPEAQANGTEFKGGKPRLGARFVVELPAARPNTPNKTKQMSEA